MVVSNVSSTADDGQKKTISRENNNKHSQGSTDCDDTVSVCVRIRPLVAKEQAERSSVCIRLPRDEKTQKRQLIIGKDRAFTFDNILDMESTQQSVYESSTSSLLHGFLEGYNATVLAYGQTGTGKTFTMGGNIDIDKISRENDGIIPRIVRETFMMMKAREETSEFSLCVEYLEIYNEDVRDLLHPETPKKNIAIREDSIGNIIVAGAKSEPVTCEEDVFHYLIMGSACRSTGSTLMNEHSSRSHAIFSLILEQKNRKTEEYRKAKFHLVDLAGSERAKKTGASGGRFKESVNINQGLLALGNVISALGGEKKKGHIHVPYRQSKLTRMLQDSLGGNSKTLMIACISPAANNFEETLNTLKYANRAKNIKNRPIVNLCEEQPANISEDKDEVLRIKEEIATLQQQLQIANSERSNSKERNSDVRANQQSKGEESEEIQRLQTIVSNYTKLSQNMAEDLMMLNSALSRNGDFELYSNIINSISTKIQTMTSVENLEGVSLTDELKDKNSKIIQKLKNDLKEAKEELVRDEKIFDMKNCELSKMKRLLMNAKSKNDTLMSKLQTFELESLTPAFSPKNNNFVCGNNSVCSPEIENNECSSIEENIETSDYSKKSLMSSRGIFTKFAGEVDDDNVMMESIDFSGSSELKSNSMKNLKDDETPNQKLLELEQQAKLQKALENAKLEFDRRTTSLKRNVRELEINIKMKEELIRTMVKSEFVERDQHAHRISELEDSILIAKQKLQFAEKEAAEYETIRKERDSAVELRRRERRDFESKILKAKSKLAALEREKKDTEYMHSLNTKNAKKVDVLKEDLSRMKDEKENLKKKMGQESQFHSLEIGQCKKELDNKEKEANKLLRKINDLERRNSALKKIADSKKGMGSSEKLTFLDSNNILSKSRGNADIDIIHQFDQHLSEILSAHETLKRIDVIQKQKLKNEELFSKANRRKNDITMKKMRESYAVRHSISDIANIIRSLKGRMESTEKGMNRKDLKLQRNQAKLKYKELKEKEQNEKFLEPELQEELEELEDHIEALEEQIRFQEVEIKEARHLLQIGGDLTVAIDNMVDNIGISNVQDSISLLKNCCHNIINTRLRERSLEEILKSLKQECEEKEKMTSQLENGLNAAKLEFDRRLIISQRESDDILRELQKASEKIDILKKEKKNNLERPATSNGINIDNRTAKKSTSQLEMDDMMVTFVQKEKYLKELEKHLMYYKSKSKQGQLQLQELLKLPPKDKCENGDLQKAVYRIKQLERANEKLMLDFAKVKTHLHSISTTDRSSKRVRIPRNELQEVSESYLAEKKYS